MVSHWNGAMHLWTYWFVYLFVWGEGVWWHLMHETRRGIDEDWERKGFWLGQMRNSSKVGKGRLRSFLCEEKDKRRDPKDMEELWWCKSPPWNFPGICNAKIAESKPIKRNLFRSIEWKGCAVRSTRTRARTCIRNLLSSRSIYFRFT